MSDDRIIKFKELVMAYGFGYPCVFSVSAVSFTWKETAFNFSNILSARNALWFDSITTAQQEVSR